MNNDVAYDNVDIKKLPQGLFSMVFFKADIEIETSTATITDFIVNTPLRNATDFGEYLGVEPPKVTSNNPLQNGFLLRLLNNIPENYEITVRVIDSCIYSIWVFNEKGNLSSENNMPSEIKFNVRCSKPSSIKFHKDGKIHRTDAAAHIFTNQQRRMVEDYYYEGIFIPPYVFEDGYLERGDLGDDTMMTLSLLGL